MQRDSSPLRVVLGTGTGKGLLAQLPALVNPTETAILIVPLVALREDFIRRSLAFGISSVGGDPSISTSHARYVGCYTNFGTPPPGRLDDLYNARQDISDLP